MSDCIVNILHNFEARYHEEEIIDHEALEKSMKLFKEDKTAPCVIIEDYKLQKKTYLFDICTKCGEKIMREEKNEYKTER